MLTNLRMYSFLVVFCGINPSLTSGCNKLHFSGRGNKFYECLLYAGLISPGTTFKEAPNFPQRFSLGLTDLVSRTTASVKELKAYEKRQSVPAFLRKIVECQPRLVCFVSLAIGETVSKAIFCPWAKPKAPRKGKKKDNNASLLPRRRGLRKGALQLSCTGERKAKLPSSEEKSEPSRNLADIQAYLLPFKLRYSEHDVTSGNAAETLFFALPSTSGANSCSYYLADKRQLFVDLHAQLQLIKEGSPDAPNTSDFEVIDITTLRA
ncbi:hypothetical protein J3R30DRAFT_1611005 [Lentinula aciculospora]|uniref:Uracil-DNA glycosylase-like domain-containing protein n=1 Tax=Lentinula aciculospora TaxID=153920 RepID=A0A9W8ZWH6_9AGAR|nr:hypothetical protein J3R30DRAFT_1611005 [Lentinula aciculospora]